MLYFRDIMFWVTLLFLFPDCEFPASKRKEHGLWCRIDLDSIPVMPLLPALNFHICKWTAHYRLIAQNKMSKRIESFSVLPDPQQHIANLLLVAFTQVVSPAWNAFLCSVCFSRITSFTKPSPRKAPSLKPLQHLVAQGLFQHILLILE